MSGGTIREIIGTKFNVYPARRLCAYYALVSVPGSSVSLELSVSANIWVYFPYPHSSLLLDHRAEAEAYGSTEILTLYCVHKCADTSLVSQLWVKRRLTPGCIAHCNIV